MPEPEYVRVDARHGTVESRQVIDRPIDEVFGFFSDARNLERITPDFLKFHVLRQSTPAIGEGTLIDYRLTIRGLPVRWTSRIEGWHPPNFFSDRQIRGPYGHWYHDHLFEREGRTTVIIDRVRFRLPMHGLTRWVALGWVARDIENIFRYRQNVIREIFAQ